MLKKIASRSLILSLAFAGNLAMATSIGFPESSFFKAVLDSSALQELLDGGFSSKRTSLIGLKIKETRRCPGCYLFEIEMDQCFMTRAGERCNVVTSELATKLDFSFKNIEVYAEAS